METQTGSGRESQQWMEQLQGTLGAGRVFGAPVESGGTLIIPVANVRGGGGEGRGTGTDASGTGSGQGVGAGFGLSARPAGVFVVRGGRVKWRPAVDANRVLLGVQVLLAAAFWIWWAHRPVEASPRRALSRRWLLRRLARG